MKQFTLQKSPSSDDRLSKFHVRNSNGDIIGHISVQPGEEADLLSHWRGAGPQAKAQAAPARASAATGKENPKDRMVNAMLAVASRNTLSPQAILRSA